MVFFNEGQVKRRRVVRPARESAPSTSKAPATKTAKAPATKTAKVPVTKTPPSRIGNIDETPFWVDMPGDYTIEQKGLKTIKKDHDRA